MKATFLVMLAILIGALLYSVVFPHPWEGSNRHEWEPLHRTPVEQQVQDEQAKAEGQP